VLYIGATIVVGLLVWAFVNLIYKARIETLGQHLASEQGESSRLRARLSEFDQKLSGASPDETRARIDALEATLRTLQPRVVSEEQRRALVLALKAHAGSIEIATDMSSPDARGFAAGLTAAFAEAGWRVTNPVFMGLARDCKNGLGLAINPSTSRTVGEQTVMDAFGLAGIGYDVHPGRLKAAEFGKPEIVELFITVLSGP